MPLKPEEREWDAFGDDLYAIPEVLPAQSTNPVQYTVPPTRADEDNKIKAFVDDFVLSKFRRLLDVVGAMEEVLVERWLVDIILAGAFLRGRQFHQATSVTDAKFLVIMHHFNVDAFLVHTSAFQEYGSHQVASSPGGPIRATHFHRGASRSAFTYSSNGLPSPSSAPRWKNILTGPRNQNILTSFSMPMATHQTSTDPMVTISFKVLEDNTLSGYESQPRLTDSTTEPIHDQVAFSSHLQQSTRFAFDSNCSDFVASLPGRPIYTEHFNGTGSRPEIPDSSNGTTSQSSDPRSTKIHTGPARQNIGTSLSMPATTQSQSAAPMGTVSVNGLEGSTTGHVPNIVRASSHLQESRRSPFCSSGSHGAEHYHGRQAEYPHPNSYRTCYTTRPYTNENFLTSLSKPVNTHQPHSTSGPIHAAHFNGISSRTENSNSEKINT